MQNQSHIQKVASSTTVASLGSENINNTIEYFSKGIAGLPTALFGFSVGNSVLSLSYNSSEIFVMAALFLFLW